jgi:hypothetical protein
MKNPKTSEDPAIEEHHFCVLAHVKKLQAKKKDRPETFLGF